MKVLLHSIPLSSAGEQITATNWTQILIACGILVALLLVGFVVVSMAKRYAASGDEPESTGFSLSELRRLHQTGQITDDEFNKAKIRIVDSARRVAERMGARPPTRDGSG